MAQTSSFWLANVHRSRLVMVKMPNLHAGLISSAASQERQPNLPSTTSSPFKERTGAQSRQKARCKACHRSQQRPPMYRHCRRQLDCSCLRSRSRLRSMRCQYPRRRRLGPKGRQWAGWYWWASWLRRSSWKAWCLRRWKVEVRLRLCAADCKWGRDDAA